jgi:hypothetical protein
MLTSQPTKPALNPLSSFPFPSVSLRSMSHIVTVRGIQRKSSKCHTCCFEYLGLRGSKPQFTVAVFAAVRLPVTFQKLLLFSTDNTQMMAVPASPMAISTRVPRPRTPALKPQRVTSLAAKLFKDTLCEAFSGDILSIRADALRWVLRNPPLKPGEVDWFDDSPNMCDDWMDFNKKGLVAIISMYPMELPSPAHMKDTHTCDVKACIHACTAQRQATCCARRAFFSSTISTSSVMLRGKRRHIAQ